MKMHKLFTFSLLLFTFFATFAVWAESETVGDITWTYKITGDTAQVGDGEEPAIPPDTTGAIVIPSTLGGKPVTSIGDSAFYDCRGLTSVTISEGVEGIGAFAFYNCKGLTSVTIPSTVTSIGKDAFRSCSGLGFGVVIVDECVLTVYGVCPNTVDLPDDVRLIADGAFSGIISLTKVTIPSSVTSIGASAFSACSGLTSVAIPSSVTSIGNSAFSDCSGLTSVTIPSSVTSIGASAFSGCRGLTSVEIPSSVTSIGANAFNDCRGLTSVTISEGVTSIGNNAFGNCKSLSGVTIPSTVTNIGEQAFASCGSLCSVTISEGVTSIGNKAFQSCKSLYSVTIPSTVTSIGEWAFSGCDKLATVSLLPKAVSIGNQAFVCFGLKKVFVSGWEVFANTDWGYCVINPKLVVGPATKDEVASASFAVAAMCGGKAVSAADYATACKAFGLTQQEMPQVVQEGEVAVKQTELQAAKAEAVTVADGVVSLGVTVNTNGNFTAETKDWKPVTLTSENVEVKDGKIVISIPVSDKSGFMILQSGDAKVPNAAVTHEPWYTPIE